MNERTPELRNENSAACRPAATPLERVSSSLKKSRSLAFLPQLEAELAGQGKSHPEFEWLKNIPKPPQKIVSIWSEFLEFAFQGSLVDLAVGIIVGGAFGKIVNSFVNDMIMPPIGWLMSGVDFANIFVLLKRGKKHAITGERYKSLKAARDDGAVTMNVGMFLNSLINFVVISAIIFGMVRTINKLKRGSTGAASKQQQQQQQQARCSLCYMKIDYRACRCPFCTSDLTDSLKVRSGILPVPSEDDLMSDEQLLQSPGLQSGAISSSSSGRPAAAGTRGSPAAGSFPSSAPLQPLAASSLLGSGAGGGQAVQRLPRNMSSGSLLEVADDSDSDSDLDSWALKVKSKNPSKKIVKKRLTQDFRTWQEWSILPS